MPRDLPTGVDWRKLGELLADPDAEGKRFFAEDDLPKIEQAVEERVREGIAAEAAKLHDEAGRLYAKHDPEANAKQGRANALRDAVKFLDSYAEQGGGEGLFTTAEVLATVKAVARAERDRSEPEVDRMARIVIERLTAASETEETHP